jgi:AcrR family transcriptional regulator
MSMALASQDGRRLRGDASRRAILEAATQVIVTDGVDHLTHRAVAAVAGVPVARISYHFPRIDDLLMSAATEYLGTFDDRLRRSAETARASARSLVDASTQFLHELVTTGAREFLAMVEVRLVLHARGQVIDDSGVLDVIRSFGADERRATSIMAAMFGYAVLAATAAEPPHRADVRAYVASILEGVR